MLTPRPLAKNGPICSPLIAGVMNWGLWGHQFKTAQIQDLIEHCLALGISTFDHADIYGNYTTEANFGKVLQQQPHLRDQMQLITKCGIKLVCPQRPEHRIKSYDTSRDHIIASVEQSLRNLQTDYIDILLIHRPDPLMHTAEIAEAVSILKRQGKIRFFGASNFTPAQFALVSRVTPLTTNQVEISLMQTEALFDGTLVQCQNRNVCPMAWTPLGNIFKEDNEKAHRILDKLDEIGEKYGAPGADVMMLAWLLQHPAKIIPVLGTGRKERLSAAVEALKIKMTREEWFMLLQASLGKKVD